jgi:DNA-binding transcriptional MerR regulator
MSADKDDLRSAIEEAFNEQQGATDAPSSETGGSEAHAEEPLRTAAPTERSEPVGDTKSTDQPAPGEVEKEKPTAEADGTPYDKTKDRAPEAWRPTSREHWAKLPPEVREEVNKREHEMYQFVQRTASQRKIADQFVNTVQPFLGMIQAEGSNPLVAVQNLLQTAAFLRTGPSGQKAQLVAKLVKDFGISVDDLDKALVGERVPEQPEDKFNALLEQRLAPVNQFIQQIQGARQQRVQQADTAVDTEINAFAQDPKNEFFRDVYNEMADLTEIAARNGRTLSLKDAYDKACQLNPAVQEALSKRMASKKAASGSLALRGASSGGAAASDDSVRGDLERAFETLAGR